MPAKLFPVRDMPGCGRILQRRFILLCCSPKRRIPHRMRCSIPRTSSRYRCFPPVWRRFRSPSSIRTSRLVAADRLFIHLDALDGRGGLATQEITVTLTGTNDRPELSIATPRRDIHEDTASVGGTFAVQDPDSDSGQNQTFHIEGGSNTPAADGTSFRRFPLRHRQHGRHVHYGLRQADP